MRRTVVAHRASMKFLLSMATCVYLGVGIAFGTATHAQGLPRAGCPKAHCSQENVDRAHLAVPEPTGTQVAAVVWEREILLSEQAGSDVGLGCSSNGAIAVCSYRGVPNGVDELNNVVAYNYNGVVKWRSHNTLILSAYPSAPLILETGTTPAVIAVDTERAIRFTVGTDGTDWDEEHDFGTPMSPVITDNGVLVLAMIGGRIELMDSADGTKLVTKVLRQVGDGAEDYFETHKTAAVSGNRVYVVMQHMICCDDDDKPYLDPDHIARLVALDVDPDAPVPNDRLVEVDHYPKANDGGLDALTTGLEGSKSSPSMLQLDGEDCLLFDGWRRIDGMERPHIFAICDDGTDLYERWAQEIDDPTFSSFAEPPAGVYFWYVRTATTFLWKARTSDGVTLVNESIDVDALIGDPNVTHRPSSAMTIGGTTTRPIMVVAAKNNDGPGTSYVLAVDLNARSLVWKVAIQPFRGQVVVPAGQFPIVTNGTNTRVVFTAAGPGVRAIGISSP